MSFLKILDRGIRRLCPQCGTESMFSGYLKVKAVNCRTCSLSYDSIRSDDVPAYFTVFIVGHIILPIILIVEQSENWSLIAHLLLWIPVTIGMTLILLPFVKGMVMAITWFSRR